MKKIVLITIALLAASTVLFANGQGAGGGSAGGQGASARAGTVPDYINPDGYYPVVKPGNNVSLTVSWMPNETMSKHSDPSQMWYFRFVKEAMNIDLQVTPRAPGAEVKNLMFASGDLPDIWLSGLTPEDIVRYGMGEKLILPISDYLTPELMPNLYKVYQDDPERKIPATASDGKIYGFSNIRGKNWLHGPTTGGLSKVFYNQKWLNQLNMKVPETLDEYLAMLRGFKSLGSDILPDAGIYKSNPNFTIVYSALGFHWTNANLLTSVGTRNDEVTFIYGNREIYPKFVETFNTMYKEGLISKDFFTMDNNTRTALTMAGKGGVIPSHTVTYTGPLSYDYVSAKPLTSELNKEIFWVSPANYVSPNLAVIMSKCKYPEAALRMFDFGYTPENGVIVTYGFPDTDKEHQYGMIQGWTIANNRLSMHIDNPALYEFEAYFSNSRIRPMHDMTAIFVNQDATAMEMYGLTPPVEAFNTADPDSNMRKSVYENLSGHMVMGFPFVVYWDEKTNNRLVELSTVINDYIQIQFAQFVTGARPLSEMNAYFAELDAMNYQEYLKYFADYYENMRAGQ